MRAEVVEEDRDADLGLMQRREVAAELEELGPALGGFDVGGSAASEFAWRTSSASAKRAIEWRAIDGPAGLTPREVEVLRLIARGGSIKDVAARLDISRRTAGTHIEHIYAKLGVSTRVEASLAAVQHGLLPEADLDRGGATTLC